MSQRTCLFCSAPIGRDTSPEHILLNALGGRATTRRVNCTPCNNLFGSTIDKAFASQIEPLRTLLNLKSGSNKPPASLRYKSSTGKNHMLHPDGNVSTDAKPLAFFPELDGKINVSLVVNELEEVRRFIPHIAAKIGLSEEEIGRQMAAADVKRVTAAAPPFTAQISLGGHDSLRSMVKACLVLCAAKIDLVSTREAAFSAARSFVTMGGADFQNSRIVLEGRDIPDTERLVREFGPIFNMIFCKSDDAAA